MNFRGPFPPFAHDGHRHEEQNSSGFRNNLQEPSSFAPGGGRGNHYGQEPVEVLMVAEKPSIARTIADSLAGGKYLTRKGRNG